jgi:hypothetical protein
LKGGLFLNSISHPNHNDDFKSISKTRRLKSAILKCGNSGSAVILAGSNTVTIFPIITINTSHLHNSCIKLNFTSNIISINLVGTVAFQLFRLCKGEQQATMIGPPWTFTRAAAAIADIKTFSFFECDCDFCPSKECKYAVVAIPVGTIVGNIVINNATLSAIAVGKFSDKLIEPQSFEHHMEQSPIISKCGCPNAAAFPGTPVNPTTTTATIASVNANTSFLCHPHKRLEFTGLIIVPVTILNAALTFQIFENCINQAQQIPVGPQWTFLTPLPTTDLFSFFVCDCNIDFNKCCTYTVQVTATILSVAETAAGVTPAVTIENATLAIFAVEDPKEDCEDDENSRNFKHFQE